MNAQLYIKLNKAELTVKNLKNLQLKVQDEFVKLLLKLN
jgi:hypothetical protein